MIDPNAWGAGYSSRPYRPNLHPPQPVTKRHLVSSKDDVYIDEHGNETRVTVEDRPAKRITRVSTFGVEHVDLSEEDQ